MKSYESTQIHELLYPIHPKRLLFLGIMRIICKNSLLQQPLYQISLPITIESNQNTNKNTNENDSKPSRKFSASSKRNSLKPENNNAYTPNNHFSSSFITQNTNDLIHSDVDVCNNSDIQSPFSPISEVNIQNHTPRKISSTNNNMSLFLEKSVQTDFERVQTDIEKLVQTAVKKSFQIEADKLVQIEPDKSVRPDDFISKLPKHSPKSFSNQSTAGENFLYKINGDFLLNGDKFSQESRYNYWKNILPTEIEGRKDSKNTGNIYGLNDIKTQKQVIVDLNKSFYIKSKGDDEKFPKIFKQLSSPKAQSIFTQEPRKIIKSNPKPHDTREKFKKEGNLILLIILKIHFFFLFSNRK